MAADRRLVAAFKGVAEAVLPDTTLSQERAVRGAINDDATVRNDALTNALPWQRIDFRLPGAVSVGTSQGGMFEMPQGAHIRHIALNARTAPSSSAFTARITDGVRSETASIPTGNTRNAVGANLQIPAGAILRLDVLQAGGADDVTVTIHYVAGGA